jgi:LPXTG-site transpeptidase (sortase) family protein
VVEIETPRREGGLTVSITRTEEPSEAEESSSPRSLLQSEGDERVHLVGGDPEDPSGRRESAASVTSSKSDGGRSVTQLVGIAITLTGLVLVLFAGYLFGWSDLQATHNQQRLLAAYERTAKAASVNGRVAADGEPVAVIDIPTLALHDIVVEGTSSADLQLGPGVMPSAPFPGTQGEAVIAGRELTYGGVFGSLGRLRAGASVVIVDYLGTFHYIVTRSFVVSPGGALPVVHSNLGSLALVTSHEALPPSGLFVVEAKLAGGPAKADVRLPSPASASELALGGDNSALLPLLGWGLLLVAVLIATVTAYRRMRPSVLVYLLTMPILLTLALLTFENAARLLPATM